LKIIIFIDTVSIIACFQYDSDIENSLNKIYSLLKPDGLLYFTTASTNAVLENKQIKYTYIQKKPSKYKDASGNIYCRCKSLFGRTIDSSGNIIYSEGNIFNYIG